LMVKGQEFVDQGIANYEMIMLKQKEKYVKKLAMELNLEIVDFNNRY